MIRAVKQLTGLPIHHLMVIKFNGFPKMVDSLGGVTVTIRPRWSTAPTRPGAR